MASVASTAPCKDPREMYALKQKAMKYYEANGVPGKMEEILNAMFYDDPSDVYGYLVNFFSQFSKPATLTKLSALQVFDCLGMPTIQTDVYCTVNNKEKLTNSSTIPSANIRSRPEDREKVELELHNSVLAAIKLINSDLSYKLAGMDPLEQGEIDDLVLSILDKRREEELSRKAQEEENVEEQPPPPPADDKDKKKSAKGKAGGKMSAPPNTVPDKPLEVFVSACEAASAVSQAVCACAAAAHHQPVYRHVAKLARTKGALHEFRVPLPMVTIIQSGRPMPGKLNCVKEYMVVPGVGMPVDKSIEYIQHIYNHVAKHFASKLGAPAKFVNETGALCPTLDTPTQAIDLLQEAVNAQGLTIGEDMYLAINAAAHEFFDFDKGRYEVTAGQMKTPDDMVEFWADILTKYPSIVAIIDPIRGEDSEQWMRLSERVSEGVFIVGDRLYERPGLLRKEELPHPVRTSGIVMNLERLNTVSDIIACANTFQDLNNEIVISTNQGDTIDTFIVDFAVGLNARFLKVGGPCRGERSSKLNRLIQIFNELEAPEPLAEEGGEDGPAEETGNKDDEKVDEADGDRGEKAETVNETPETKLETPEEQEQETTPVTWGEEEKSRLKLHTQFTFPLIENPPPPQAEGEEEGEKEGKPASPTSKHGK